MTGARFTFRFYLFGCVAVTSAGDFTFLAAPNGTWFEGHNTTKWIDMFNVHCSSLRIDFSYVDLSNIDDQYYFTKDEERKKK